MKKSLFGILALTLAACGGGGGGGNPADGGGNPGGGGNPPPAGAAEWIVYVTPTEVHAAKTDGSADVTLPGTPNSQAIKFIGDVYDYAFDPNTQTVSNMQRSEIVYSDGGIFWRVPVRGDQPPVATQVSGWNNLICSNSSLSGNYFQFVAGGPDGVCNTSDDESKVAWLGMTASDMPRNGRFDVALSTYDNTVQRLLAITQAGLVAFDGQLSNPQTLLSGASSVQSLGTLGGPLDQRLLQVDDGLRIYNIRNNTLSDVKLLISGTLGYYAKAYGGYYYFSVDNTLYRLAVDGSANAEVLITETGALSASFRDVLNDKLIYDVTAGGFTAIRAYDLASGSTTDLVTTEGTTGMFLRNCGNSANNIFYVDINTNTTPITFSFRMIDTNGVITDLGAGQCLPYQMNTRFRLANSLRPRYIPVVQIDSNSIYITDLQVFDVDSPMMPTTFTLPNARIRELFNSGIGFGSRFSYNMIIDDGTSNGNVDIVTFVADQANSLLKITDTPNTSEYLIDSMFF